MSHREGHCFACRSVFEVETIASWLDDGETPRCPRCGMDAVGPGRPTVVDLEREHVLAFGAWGIVGEALQRHGVSLDGAWPDWFGEPERPRSEPYEVHLETAGRHLVVRPPARRGEPWAIFALRDATPVEVGRAATTDEVGALIADLLR